MGRKKEERCGKDQAGDENSGSAPTRVRHTEYVRARLYGVMCSPQSRRFGRLRLLCAELGI